MMENVWLILAAAVATYLTRIAGFSIGRRPIPQAAERFLSYVPIAAFAALITPGIAPGNADLLPRFIAIGLAALVVLRWRVLWAGLASGMAVFWLTSFLLTGGPV
jgi:branched-subunit amino acid transport protein